MTRAGFVFRQVKARPLRAFLTAGAFAFSVGLLGFVMVLGRALEQDWSVFQGQRVIVMAKTSMFDKLPLAYLGKIQVDPGVEEVVPFDFMMGAYKDMRAENQVPVSGSDSVKLLTVYREATLTDAHRKAWVDDPTGCVIGPILAKKFGWKVGDRIVLKTAVQGGVLETTVRGIFDYKADNGLYIHRKYLEQLTGDTGTVGMFWILAKTRDDVDRITKNLNAAFENAPVPARAMSEKQWQLNFMQMLGNVKLLFGSIAMATAFTLLLITANSLAMSARERRNQTGVLRVLGFQKAEVAGFLFGEALLYGIFGGLLGIALIFTFCTTIGAAVDKTQYAGLGALLVPSASVLLIAFGTSTLLAALAGVVPALGLTRRSITDLLRETS